MNDSSQYLLNDEAMQRFIIEGYTQLKSELPDAYHARMYGGLEPLDETGPLGHNNLLPCVPDLRLMLNEPQVVGALTSILGPDYYLHFHRHDHVNFPDGAQPLHKDSDNHSHHAIDGLRRYHKTRFAMLLYYPQDTPVEMGPTGIVPRSQYVSRRDVDRLKKHGDQLRAEILEQIRQSMDATAFEGKNRFKRYAETESEFRVRYPDLVEKIEATSAPWEDAKIPLVGDAGTISIVHFDIVHGRFSANLTGKQRHMVKFVFCRNEEPTTPSWNHRDPVWLGGEDDCQTPIWKHLWAWHLGTNDSPVSPRLTGELSELLDDQDDKLAISAAYELGSISEGFEVLLEKFLSDNLEVRSIAGYGLVRAGGDAIPRLLAKLEGADPALQARIIDVIGDIGLEASDAAPVLTALAASSDVGVRRTAIEALGVVSQAEEPTTARVLAALENALIDEDAVVVRNATLALARLGSKAKSDTVVDRVSRNLSHWHHHVRGWSIEALQQMDDPKAMKLALQYLMSARWDYASKTGDLDATSQPMREPT
ncbi:MAG: HEAT repeat domain-containing protein [Pseudomonadales bacterium]|nr:HEAT repeat domain-containing protein [Pseudomonadales bacterium]